MQLKASSGLGYNGISEVLGRPLLILFYVLVLCIYQQILVVFHLSFVSRFATYEIVLAIIDILESILKTKLKF
jgi:hypothetical protein